MQWIDRVGRRLKLRDLHILLAVVQSRSMAKAASELAISQPAVSKAIADMEYALGLRLLDRTRQGIEPTMYGRALIRRGLVVFDELRQGVKELEFLADPTAGELRIGSQESIAAGLLPAALTGSRDNIHASLCMLRKPCSARCCIVNCVNARSTLCWAEY